MEADAKEEKAEAKARQRERVAAILARTDVAGAGAGPGVEESTRTLMWHCDCVLCVVFMWILCALWHACAPPTSLDLDDLAAHRS